MKSCKNNARPYRLILLVAVTSIGIGCGRTGEESTTNTRTIAGKKAKPCEKPSKLTCPPGEVDACEVAAAPVHVCVPADQNVPCDQPSNLSCSWGELDACDINAAPVHICVSGFYVDCGEPLQLTCPPGEVDACEINAAPAHICTPNDQNVPCDQPSNLICGPGEIDACDINAAPIHTCVPHNPSSPPGCDAIKQAVDAELTAVAQCSSDAQCKWSRIGSGCSDGALPLCGFPHTGGASLSLLESLDQQYRDQSCGGDMVACADCVPGPLSLSCVSGECMAQH